MCTIGWVREAGRTYTFKQCDLTTATTFFEPETVQGQAGPYLAFRRQGRPGIWAGVNESGVSFVAADYYTNSDPGEPSTAPVLGASLSAAKNAAASTTAANDPVNDLFLAYEASIANHGSAQDAMAFLSEWYTSKRFPAPDIALIADAKQAFFLEYYPGDNGQPGQVQILIPGESWFASTNHARMFTQTVDYTKNHSTYLRLARAEALLGQQASLDGIKTVLQDQYYGQTELSICREGKQGQYYTQATVITHAGPGVTSGAQYLINGNPREKPYSEAQL